MKEWFQQNRWLGAFLVAFGTSMLAALILLWMARSNCEQAIARFKEAVVERNRLERLDPFPNDNNYKEMQNLIRVYRTTLDTFKKEIKGHALLEPPLAPNEFQSRLRDALTVTAEKARFNGVKLPDKFFLGFDDFAAALPNPVAASLLGQELAQIQHLMNILIDARVDGVTEFHRSHLLENGGVAATSTTVVGGLSAPQPTTQPATVQRSIVNLKFTAAPSVARKVLNEIASANEQFFIIRTLQVRNQQEKGPPRELEVRAASVQPTPAKQPGALNFIVGNEHIAVSARIEIVRFDL
jgi:hypothetical protein